MYLLIFSLAASAQDWTALGWAWDAGHLPVATEISCAGLGDIDEAEILASYERAMADWSSAVEQSCGTLPELPGVIATDTLTGPAQDGRHTITCGVPVDAGQASYSVSWPGTEELLSLDGQPIFALTEADLDLNPDLDWTLDQDSCEFQWLLDGVMLHQVAHLLGLGSVLTTVEGGGEPAGVPVFWDDKVCDHARLVMKPAEVMGLGFLYGVAAEVKSLQIDGAEVEELSATVPYTACVEPRLSPRATEVLWTLPDGTKSQELEICFDVEEAGESTLLLTGRGPGCEHSIVTAIEVQGLSAGGSDDTGGGDDASGGSGSGEGCGCATTGAPASGVILAMGGLLLGLRRRVAGPSGAFRHVPVGPTAPPQRADVHRHRGKESPAERESTDQVRRSDQNSMR